MTNEKAPDAPADGPPRPFWQGGEAFVLLDFEGVRRLWRNPVEWVEARAPDEVRPALERLRGREAAGFLAYEAGHSLEPKLDPLALPPGPSEPPLLWFGIFETASSAIEPLPDPRGAWAGPPVPLVDRGAHEAAIEAAKAHILDGDIYQANLTFPAQVATAGHPLALYEAIRPRARAGWGGVVFTGAHWVLSFSPELFFTIEGRTVTARPMKGTAPADTDPGALRADPKQRAENLMIVDLMRNDLARVSRPGTVEVPKLFEVERYPTVLQMTSTIVSELAEGRDAVDLLQTIFPCGSVTGAPKIRAMEIIAALEERSRGPYTGSIGRLASSGDAAFNVAIRTLVMRDGENGARMGLGSGIVADSEAGAEWRECLAKGAFVATARPFDLVETMRFDPHDGIFELERHLARLKRSAQALGFAFDRHHARNELQAATFFLKASRKLRLLLSRTGAICVEARPVPAPSAGPAEVMLAALPVDPDDFRLRHKTSDRRFYDEAREASRAFECVFVDPDGRITEGSFTSVFVERDGRLLTPPLSGPVLPGILRDKLIEEGEAEEAELGPEDLTGPFFIGNAVRGLIPARLVRRPAET
ncbi:MAG TPA: aminodeoxychorismate synthase component I [Allosphingosinicella sp.]|nr:aminodeoxychorismate synthase component I [Allosphingosinicella sp.]